MFGKISAMYDAEFARIEREYLEPSTPAKPIYYCDCCGEGIGFDESFYRIDGLIYCDNCIDSMKHTVYESDVNDYGM